MKNYFLLRSKFRTRRYAVVKELFAKLLEWIQDTCDSHQGLYGEQYNHPQQRYRRRTIMEFCHLKPAESQELEKAVSSFCYQLHNELFESETAKV
jgi:hypothetical protein